jgi:predicted ATPase
MLRRVGIERFRGFQNLEVELRPLTAMIGKNSAGKTTVLQAVRLAYDAAQLALATEEAVPRLLAGDRIRLCDKLVVTDPSRLIALADWRQIFTDGVTYDGLFAQIDLEFDASDPVRALEVTLAYGRNAQLVLTIEVFSAAVATAVAAIPVKSKDRPPRIRSELARQMPMAWFVPAFYGVTRLEEYRTAPVIGRALGAGDQSHIVRNLVARLDPPGLERLNIFLDRTVGARVTWRTTSLDADTTEHLNVYYRDTNGELELSSAGAGLVSLIALWSALERTRYDRRGPAVFLLDEPEAHMHPRLQGDLGEAIARAAAEYGVQLLIATHSVEMINRLGQLPGTQLLAVDRVSNSATALSSEAEIVSSLDAFCDLTPYTSLSFLASRRVVFHEGPTDWKVLSACARIYFRSDDKRLAAWQRYVGIPLEGVGNVSAHGVLEKLLTPSVFPIKIAASAPVRAVLIHDRDATGAPSAPAVQKLKPHLEAIDVVWSRYCIESMFLDVPCLVEWLRPLGLGTEAELRGWLTESVDVANGDVALNDAAIDARERFHARPKKGSVNHSAARAESRKEVRAAPETWQDGKERAKRILAELRSRLPGPKQRALRGGIDDVIVAADPNLITGTSAALPAELRELLDAMVA